MPNRAAPPKSSAINYPGLTGAPPGVAFQHSGGTSNCVLSFANKRRINWYVLAPRLLVLSVSLLFLVFPQPLLTVPENSADLSPCGTVSIGCPHPSIPISATSGFTWELLSPGMLLPGSHAPMIQPVAPFKLPTQKAQIASLYPPPRIAA